MQLHWLVEVDIADNFMATISLRLKQLPALEDLLARIKYIRRIRPVIQE